MENLIWFGANRKENLVCLHSFDALMVIHFIRGLDFCIDEIYSFKNNTETSLKWPNEPSFWHKKENANYSIGLTGLIENIHDHQIASLKIRLENKGYINFSYGQLQVVIDPLNVLKIRTIKVLKMYGYFAAEKIWDFSINYDEMLLLDCVAGIEPEDITDHFDIMKKYSDEFYLK